LRHLPFRQYHARTSCQCANLIQHNRVATIGRSRDCPTWHAGPSVCRRATTAGTVRSRRSNDLRLWQQWNQVAARSPSAMAADRYGQVRGPFGAGVSGLQNSNMGGK
jgi:hypothetical protein